MSGIRLELANPEGVKDYVEKHLAPVATELHRIVNELMDPGSSSAEEWAVDMVPSRSPAGEYMTFNRAIRLEEKKVVFDGSEYFTLPKELLKSKQVKVQMTAVIYTLRHGFSEDSCRFRLVDEDGLAILGSHFQSDATEPETVTRILPFGDQDGSISSKLATYYLQGNAPDAPVQPVCRRFSLSFVYI